jgi:hypothetical protein
VEAAARKQSRFWVAVQPSIVRLYKVAGLFALSAILIGLIGFLVVNVFYFFDHTWVRPVVLSPTHPKVVEATSQLSAARSRLSQLEAEQLSIQGDLAAIDRTVLKDDKELAEVGTSADNPKTPEQWQLHFNVESLRLDKENENGRRAPLKSRLDSLALLLQEQKDLTHKLEQSPYLRATSHNVVLAFVPYQNLRNVALGTKLYACSWGLVNCGWVGKVTGTIEGEVENIHPHDESVQRGIMIEIELKTPSAEGSSVLFAGGKPLWLF